MKNQLNDLRHTATKTVGKEVITVNICLNDECKNGQQDFSITGTIYEAGKPKTDKNMISAGCIHEDIAKAFPEFIPFIRLHLADAEGIPMYAVENGYYNLNRIDDYCSSYRVTPDQLGVLRTARNKTQFALLLVNLGIMSQWKQDADKAIKQLETLTGQEFVNDSKKSQFNAPSTEDIAKEEKRQAQGYYTPEKEEERAEQSKQATLDKLQADLSKEIAKHTKEYEVKKEVFLKGGKKALENCIFYNHTQQLSFNWRNYDNLPVEFINNLIPTLQLPEGVTAVISTNK